MAEINDIRIKFIVEDEQLLALGDLAEEPIDKFRDSFSFFTRDFESTFFKFDKQVETSFNNYKNELERLNSTDSPFDTIFQTDNNFFKSLKSTFKFIGGDDIFNATLQAVGFIGEELIGPFRKESVVVDVPIQPNFLFNNPPEPIEGGFVGLAKRSIENEVKKGKTIGEVGEAFRDLLQQDLFNEFNKFGDFEFPELKVNIPNLQLQLEKLDRKDLLEQLDPRELSKLAVNASDEQLRAFLTLKLTIEDLNDQYNLARESLKAQAEAMEGSTTKAEQAKASTAALANDGIMPLNENLKVAAEKAEQTEKSLGGLGKEVLGADKDTKKLVKQVDGATDQIGDFNDEASDVDLKNTFDGVPEEIIKPEAVEQIKSVGPELVKSAETGKRGLSSLGVFAGNIATNIAESFSGFISTAIKGDFDGIGDLWDSLQDSFADFLGGLLADPIRLAFEATLTGGDGGIGDFFKDLFGGGKDKTEKNPQNVIFLDGFREKRGEIHQIDENEQKFKLAA